MKKFLSVIFAFTIAMLVAIPQANAALLSKEGRLIASPAVSAGQVVGFDYINEQDGSCYKYYAANPPLMGMTQPEEISCPVGIQGIEDYSVDYKKAIDLFQQANCGSSFKSISLSWPLLPEADEPSWRITSELGNEVQVGADTGRLICVR